MVRFGICNDSAQLNNIVKGSDLIGITPVVVTPQMVGTTVGLFTGVEVKKPGWKYSPSDKRVAAQLAFGKLVVSMGGLFTFATSVEKMKEITDGFTIAK